MVTHGSYKRLTKLSLSYRRYSNPSSIVRVTVHPCKKNLQKGKWKGYFFLVIIEAFKLNETEVLVF